MNLTGINQENFETWFFDYFEGNLTLAEMKSVELFVEQHYEYKVEFLNWQSAYLKDNLTNTLPQEALSLMRPVNSGFEIPHHLLDLSLVVVIVVCLFSGKIITSSPSDSSSQVKEHPAKKAYLSGKKSIKNSPAVFSENNSGQKVNHIAIDNFPEMKVDASASTPTIADSPHEDSIISASGIQDVSNSDNPAITEILPSTEEHFIQEEIQEEQSVKKISEDQSVKNKSKISGSIRRRINKNLRKAEAQKKQHELLKGDEPYVVPINKDLF